MILTALLLTLLAVAVCAVAVQRLFLALGLDLDATLLWLGLAEAREARPARRRAEPTRPLRLVESA